MDLRHYFKEVPKKEYSAIIYLSEEEEEEIVIEPKPKTKTKTITQTKSKPKPKPRKKKPDEYIYNLVGDLVLKPKIGYIKLMNGLKDFVKPFSIMDNGERRKGTIDDLLFLMVKNFVIDRKHEPEIREITLHPRCLKKEEANCICGQEQLRYLAYISVPVQGKTKKITNLILGSKCVENIINDHSGIYYNRNKELLDKLNDLHKELIDSSYFRCTHCNERNRPKTSDMDSYSEERLLYCKVCIKELHRLKRIYFKAVRNRDSWASNYKYRIDNF